MKKIFAVVASLFVAVAAYAGEFPDISIKEVKALVASKKAVLVDVNGTQSWQKGHIPGALDFDAIEKDFSKSLPADKNALIVAYCALPPCNAYRAAAEAAAKLAYKNVKQWPPGISGVTGAGAKPEACDVSVGSVTLFPHTDGHISPPRPLPALAPILPPQPPHRPSLAIFCGALGHPLPGASVCAANRARVGLALCSIHQMARCAALAGGTCFGSSDGA